jgi:hypothetical protein
MRENQRKRGCHGENGGSLQLSGEYSPGAGGGVAAKAKGIETKIAGLTVGVGEHVCGSDGEPVAMLCEMQFLRFPQIMPGLPIHPPVGDHLNKTDSDEDGDHATTGSSGPGVKSVLNHAHMSDNSNRSKAFADSNDARAA